MKVIERIVKSEGAPSENDLWLDHASGNPELKEYHNGEWVSLVKSLQDQVDAMAAQLENLKEYTAGLGINISEEGEISTPLVVEIEGAGQISQELYERLRFAAAISYNGTIYPRLKYEVQMKDTWSTNIIAAFGYAIYETNTGDLSTASGFVVGDDGTDEEFRIVAMEV